MNKTVIKVKNVFKSFFTGNRYTPVLKDISMDVSEGEFLIIFGPSGCGKSTLLHVIMGLECPDKGNVDLYGINISKMNTDDIASIRKRDIGIMYQEQNWIKALDVKENLAFSTQLLGFSKEEALEKAMEVLGIVGMKYRADYIPSELSVGEQQKIGVARALITNPKIVIADEPTGNLDIKSGLVIANLLKGLSKKGITVIMVTHNPNYLNYADRVIFMIDGKLNREVNTKKEKIEEIEREIRKKISSITDEKPDDSGHNILKLSGGDNESYEIPKKNILQQILYSLYFNVRFLCQITIMFYLGLISMLSEVFAKLTNHQKNVKRRFDNFCKLLEGNGHMKISTSISSLDLTEISLKNLLVKKSRTDITILGISLGIGFIIFLLSIGYGMERLIISEISKAENQKQIDVLPVAGSGVEIDSVLLEQIEQISAITKVYPLINLAAKVSYNGASTDTVAYGVTNGYLEDSLATLIAGEYIKNHEKSSTDHTTEENNITNEVVVNKSYIDTLEINDDTIIGKSLDIDFIKCNTNSETEIKKNELLSYKVIGIVDDGNPPVIYIMQKDLGIDDQSIYSELRIVLESNDNAQSVRQQIELLGLQTNSVMDTIAQVESLFQYIKIVLLLFGAIGFIIAILGMVNALTVSLLERTREVGLMKTIGMKSDEIRAIFINESMIMGFTGGLIGVIIGIIGGRLASIILSILSIYQNGEMINISYIPFGIAIIIVLASTLIGYITGIYPSNRAVKMNPLDAIRYE